MWTGLMMLLGGLLTRADGWGPENDEVRATWPRWQVRASEFFSAWSCGGLFAILALLYTNNPVVALVSGGCFVLWRAPGFHGWQDPKAMFIRGLWPTLIGFTILSYVAHGHVFFGALCLLMGVFEAVAYSGAYKYLPGKVPNWAIHVTAEITSGLAFTGLMAVILQGVEPWTTT